MTDAPFDVVGIGNAIVDVVAQADEAFVRENGLVKGAMTLIDEARSDELYALMPLKAPPDLSKSLGTTQLLP